MTMHGQEIMWNAYLLYLKDWIDCHKGLEFFCQSPACYQEWLDNEMEAMENEGE